jgi:4-hydroxy-tetrahydrodipicolinate synthase
MDKRTVDWRGPMTALVTPFDAKGAIDEAAYRRNVDLNLEAGVTGLLANGCTGEFWAMSIAEQKRVMSLCLEQAAGRAPVIAGCSAITTADAIDLAEHAKEIGCSGISVMPPFLVRPPVDDVIAHFHAIADAVDIPMMLYNFPFTNLTELTPDLINRLADVRTAVAVKESTFDFQKFTKTLQLAQDRLHVFVGPAAMFGVPALVMGASGYIDLLPNYWRHEAVELHNAAVSGKVEEARRLQMKALSIRDVMSGNGRNGYAAVKAAMNLLGLPGGYPRLPLRPLGEPHLTELRTGLGKLGLSMLRAAA